MKILAALTFILAIFVAPMYAHAQQKGTVSFNGNIFDTPQWPDAGYTQSPTQSAPAKAKTSRHVKRHVSHKNSAS
jgi:type 1 fimbria pilin